MNREQWQQKRGQARAPSAPIAITLAQIAHRVDDTARGAARPAANIGGQAQAEESAVKARHRKP